MPHESVREPALGTGGVFLLLLMTLLYFKYQRPVGTKEKEGICFNGAKRIERDGLYKLLSAVVTFIVTLGVSCSYLTFGDENREEANIM